jgi:MATE family multidrug resistance protein
MLLKAIRDEMPDLLRLAFPLILGELGWISMSLVDTIMVGRMRDPAFAMAATALASVLFNTLTFGLSGVLLGLDALISQSFGENDIPSANRWLLHGLAMAGLLAAALLSLLAVLPLALAHLPADPRILAGAIPALRGLMWGVLPLLVYFALRRYLQAAHLTRPIAIALISANLVNAALDWLLIFGHRFTVAGHVVAIPAFGVVGSSWSTSLARVYLMLALLFAVWHADRRKGFGLLGTTRLRIEASHLARLLRLGAPAGAQIIVEIAIFALVTSLIATMGPLPLAGHEIALQCASTSFMVPLAISAATAVRVGHALGRMNIGHGGPLQVAAAGWCGIAAGAGAMLISAAFFLTIPARVAGLFTPDAAVIRAAVPLLIVAAGFQFFDGIQVAATGALRGAGQTMTPFWTQLVCFWFVGMPLGWALAFHANLGAQGLWLGLLISLAGAAVVMCFAWRRTMRKLTAATADTA